MVDIEKEQEIWKTYPEFPFIEASNLGRVRTKDKIVKRSNGRKYYSKGRVLKQRIGNSGYMQVQFRVNGKNFNLLVHRIMAICFIPNPLDLPEVNHIDNNPTNNRWDNLEWCDRKYNIEYREKCGISAKESTKVLRKPVIAVDLNTFEVFWFESQSEATRQLSVHQGSVSNVVKGERDKTEGYWFCHADENAVEKVRRKFGDEIAKKVKELMNGN